VGTVTASIQIQGLEQLHPAAGDPVAAAAALRDASARCDRALAADASLEVIVEVLEHVLGEPRNLRSASWVIERTAAPAEALRYEAAVAELSHELGDKTDQLVLRLSRALTLADQCEIAALNLRALAARAKRVAAHLPNEATQRWLSIAQRAGVDASVNAHHALLWEQAYGVVCHEQEEHVVTHQSIRTLLQHRDPWVRRQTAHVTASYAAQRASVLEPLKRGRLACLRDIARTLGHRDVYEQMLLETGLTQGAIDALLQQQAPLLELTGKYYEWKRRRLGLDELNEADLAARACPTEVDLSFGRLLDCVRANAGRLDPDYPGIVQELEERHCILTKPDATRSGQWCCIENLAGTLPFVHMPYHADYETFVAAAHELGHACQLTASARRVGALRLYGAPAWFAETFSLRAEIEAVHTSLERESHPLERAFWAEAAIDQWLHFVRTLQIAGRFDLELHREPGRPRQELSAARERIRVELSPAIVRSATEGEDASWLLQTHSEHTPCIGLHYGLAMLIAYRSCLDGLPLSELSDHGASLRIDEACARYLSFDVESAEAFASVWQHMDRLFDSLVEAAN
jgi:oligoendopeptidase F